jgi:hypothetical protein
MQDKVPAILCVLLAAILLREQELHQRARLVRLEATLLQPEVAFPHLAPHAQQGVILRLQDSLLA